MQESSADAVTRRETSSRVWVAYALLLAAAVAGFFVIRHYGSGLVAPPVALPQTSDVETAAASGSLLRLLIALIAVDRDRAAARAGCSLACISRRSSAR